MSAKNELRRIAIDRRRAMTQQTRDEKSRMISENLISLLEKPEYAGVQTVFSYRATWDEADVDKFNAWARAKGMRLAFPISLPGGVMKAAVPGNEAAWKIGAYGIKEPIEADSEILDPQEFDLIIVPCVAFDRQGRRCGHGAGYYDRFMSGIRPEVAVMAAFDVQEADLVETEETDVPVKVIVTESGIIRVQRI